MAKLRFPKPTQTPKGKVPFLVVESKKGAKTVVQPIELVAERKGWDQREVNAAVKAYAGQQKQLDRLFRHYQAKGEREFKERLRRFDQDEARAAKGKPAPGKTKWITVKGNKVPIGGK